jgi:antitoxin component YwqK of YwqJK toxin-antitoxin module
MKRYIPLLALLLASLLYPQTKMDINNLIDRGGLLYAPNNDKPYSGSVFDFHENGQKKFNGRYRNGIKNGKWKWWNEDGVIDSTGSYKNGLMHGQWKFYFSNGNLEGKGQYRDGNGTERGDTGISRHGRHGKWTFWYESGVLKTEQNWKNGKFEKLGTTWFENGKKSYEATYKDDVQIGKYTDWYDNGQKMYEGTFKNGDLISEKCWDEDGNEKDCN